MELEFASGMPMPEAWNQRAQKYIQTSNGYNFPPGTEDLEAKKAAFMAIRSRLSNAPHIVIACADNSIVNSPWGFSSMGIIGQTICLTAMEYGLGTCILGGPASRPGIVREVCGIPDNKTIVFGIIIGYADDEARINHFPRTRLALDEFVRWIGF
jgi:nitroreductase